MAMQLNIGASSSSTLVAASKLFDVFISFRGEDTRRKFTSHLNEALKRSGVKTFIDDNELKKGDEISTTLIKAIEESCASIVIFSKDYASSKWCLNELVKIVECKKYNGQIVIPIFYEIDPSHVRNQIGSYGQAFAKHWKHKKDKLQKWKDALTEVSNLSGWDSKNSRIESDFIKDIVKDVLKQLNHRRPFEVNKELVGIEEKYEEIELFKNIGSNDVRTLGLWGMGGIGKTALAKSLYARYFSQFEYHCFLENVREESTRCGGLNGVRNKLFSTLLKPSLDAPYFETPTFKKRLERAKCLIVLDDVATLEQAENLKMGLGPGSRVIVTTRDRQICLQFEGCVVHEVKELNEDESLQLFSCNAFHEKHAKEGYEELSKSAIGYCRGNPLALKVLGANLGAKSKEAWESELEKIKEIPYAGIHDVLKLSFYDLDCTQRDIFLDIACFFYPKINEFACYRQREIIIDIFNACKKLNFVRKKQSNDRGFKSLIILNLSGCTQINTSSMWFIFDGARYLKYLNLRNCCNLETLPDNIQNCLMLEILCLDGCINLNSLPKLPASLRKLTAINCTYLDTNSIQREMLENMLYRFRTENHVREPFLDPLFSLLPVAEVPRGFDFFTTEASIVIPPIPIPKDGFYHIVLCVFLSEGFNLTSSRVYCTINSRSCEWVKWNVSLEYVSGTMISDHVLLICPSDIYHPTRDSLSFEVKTYVDDGEQLSTKGIKGCGVILVSSLEHSLGLDGSSSSRSKVEIAELPFNAQVSDEFDQHSKFDDDENEDAQQQLLITAKENEEDLNYKSSCDCSIGLWLQQLLEESKRLFLSVST